MMYVVKLSLRSYTIIREATFVNLKKVIIFNHLEIKKRMFLVTFRVKINGFNKNFKSLGLDEFLGWVPW